MKIGLFWPRFWGCHILTPFLQNPLFQASKPLQGTHTRIMVYKGSQRLQGSPKEAKAPLNRVQTLKIRVFSLCSYTSSWVVQLVESDEVGQELGELDEQLSESVEGCPGLGEFVLGLGESGRGIPNPSS